MTQINPLALSPEDLARLLSAAAGRDISREMIAADLAAGAPQNPDGTVNVVHYTAWLAGESRKKRSPRRQSPDADS